MSNFYDKLPFDMAAEMERLSRLMYELRENRKTLVAQHDVADEDALLQGIADGRIAEHPAYEHYLGSRIVGAAHDAVRAQLRTMTSGRDDTPLSPPLHAELTQLISSHFADGLEGPVRLAQDALLLRLVNGVAVEIRFADATSYAINWQWGDAAQRIDTAPLHRHAKTFPNHWHDAAGEVRGDPLTEPGRTPWDNTREVIEALLADPLLEA